MTYATRRIVMIGTVILIVSYVIVGMRGLALRLQAEPRTALGPFSTSDSFLGAVLQLSEPSRAVVESLEAVPTASPLVFVGAADDLYFLRTYYTISYLAWPLPVTAVECGGSGRARIVAGPHREASTTAAIVYSVVSTDQVLGPVPGQMLGPRLRITADTSSVGWSSFCP